MHPDHSAGFLPSYGELGDTHPHPDRAISFPTPTGISFFPKHLSPAGPSLFPVRNALLPVLTVWVSPSLCRDAPLPRSLSNGASKPSSPHSSLELTLLPNITCLLDHCPPR